MFKYHMTFRKGEGFAQTSECRHIGEGVG